ncbi:mechanosensitive ion channel [Candidatus Chloroploca sp. M-50]|uniref:Mechanosensitive ion channel n=1 Tax=Candidatus Chloroploca mongolica TaxID=2528176 RepID=A0ABS4DGL2_9CHLR|nr:mechanosensitive ion channel domain-containing protein [Candidatus Chloroploca mongolica]MBP1468581.1 mechanosensitive ion channel [Candidatus Chloroploca mongolica]
MNDSSQLFRDLSQINLVQVGLILVGSWLLIATSQRLLQQMANRLDGRYRLFLLASVPVLRLLIIVIAIVLTIPRVINPTFENLVALLGAAGLALGFAFKDYVSSLIAGIVTLFEMPYRPGDWIEVDGTYGEVKSISMRSVKIVTPDDTVVIVPHLKLWDQLIFNANDGGPYLLCVTNFYLHPNHDAARVKHILYDVALTSSFVQLEKPINVIVLDKPWGTHYRLKAYPVDPRQQFHFMTDLTIRGKDALREMGVEFSALSVMESAQ